MLLPSSGTEAGAVGCAPCTGTVRCVVGVTGVGATGCVPCCIPNFAAVEEENNPDYSMHTNLNWYSLPHTFKLSKKNISWSIFIAPFWQ